MVWSYATSLFLLLYLLATRQRLAAARDRHSEISQAARDAVLLERENFRNLFRQTPEMVCILSGPDHVFEFCNEAHVRALGFDATGMAVRKAQPESVEVHGILDEVVRTGETAFLKKIPVTLGNKRRYFDLTYAARRDRFNRPNGVMILGAEVTEEIEARQAVLSEKQKFERLFDESSSMMALLRGPEFVFEKVNPLYQHYTGDRDLVGKPLLEAMPELRGQVFHELLSQVYESGDPYVGKEIHVRLIRGRGGSFEDCYFNFTYTRLLDGEGHPYGVYVHANDITDAVVARKQVEEALQTRDEFLSVASHELKTPLTSLKMQAQLHARAVRRGDPAAYSSERVTEVMNQVEKQVVRLTRLVDDMLDVARIRSSRFAVEKAQCDLGGITAEVLERMEPQFRKAGYELPILSTSGEMRGNWDALRLEQVVTNLLTNAIRYGAGKPIGITVQGEANGARLTVSDHGIGIAPEAFEKIFDRFERAVGPNDASGLGLGLFVARHIVSAHGGEITVESEPGKGSQFQVSLPREMRPE